MPEMQFDMESQIHLLEQEAYRSVLRAFKAQSDALSWEKEGLITELRKELRVSDDEHRELLTNVNADDIICRIREWRKIGENHSMLNVSQPMHDLLPSPTASASWKKQKTSKSVPPAFGAPVQGLYNHSNTAIQEPSFAATKRTLSFGPGGRKLQPAQQLLRVNSMMSTRYPSSGPTPRGLNSINHGSSINLSTNDHVEVARRDLLIGRKVMTRWPEDNNFYEAVITDYNPQEGRHALVYDRNTPLEAWEWVNLKEISPQDIRWVDEDPGLSHQSGPGIQGLVEENLVNPGTFSNSGRGIPVMIDEFDKELPPSQNGVAKASDDIEILHTDTLIKEVQKLFSANHPSLLEIEKAKKVLKEHEQALMDVISKLADASDSESAGDHRHLHGQTMDGEQRWINASGNPNGPFSEVEARN